MIQGDDRLLQALANLRSFTPDTEWEKSVRLRCHAKIVGRRSKPSRVRLVDAVTLAVLFAYLAAVFGQSARLLGLL